MTRIFAILLLLALCGCDCSHSLFSYPISTVDGKPMAPGSWHSAHVENYTIYNDAYRLDDGSLIKLFYTGGTDPQLPVGAKGILYVSVPSYADDDGDSTYYFQKFMPDKGKP